MIELVKNMQMCVTHSLRSNTKTRSCSPHCYLDFIRFFFSFSALPFFAFACLWKHTEELNTNVALVLCENSMHPSSLTQPSGDLKCLNLPIAPPAPPPTPHHQEEVGQHLLHLCGQVVSLQEFNRASSSSLDPIIIQGNCPLCAVTKDCRNADSVNAGVGV